MDHETARMDRFEQGVRAMSPQERDAMKAALKAIDALPPNCREMMLDRVTEIAAARGRAQARRTSDRITDLRRRTLVGARVPRALKEQCRAQAQARGVSLYRFVLDALEQACHNGHALSGEGGCSEQLFDYRRES